MYLVHRLQLYAGLTFVYLDSGSVPWNIAGCYIMTQNVMSHRMMSFHDAGSYVTTHDVISRRRMLCQDAGCYVKTQDVMS